MALPTITITGSVQTGDGVGLTSGIIKAEISQSASYSDGTRVVGEVLGTITAGTVSSLALAPNDVLTPAGTYWKVSIVNGKTADNRPYHDKAPEKWQLSSAPSSIAYGDVPRIVSNPPVVYGVDALTLAARDQAVAARDSTISGLATKVTASGGDVSATVATPTGGTQTAMGAALDKALRQGSPRLVEVFNLTAPLHSTNPSFTLFDKWVDLAEYGIAASSDLLHLNARIEKQNELGEWVPCHFPGGAGWADLPDELIPVDDPVGYPVKFGFLSNDFDTPVDTLVANGVLADLVDAPWMGTDVRTNGNLGNSLQARWPRLRCVAWADCSDDGADYLGYRVHLWAYAPDLSVFSEEVEIPTAETGLPFYLRELSLPDLGLTTTPTDLLVTMSLRRNGALIRKALVRPAIREMGSTQYDPPAPPIKLWASEQAPLTEWWHPQNAGNRLGPYLPQYGEIFGYGPADAVVWAGSYRAANFAECPEQVGGRVSLAAWRSGALLTEYVATEGEVAVPVPAGSAEGCTLLVKVFRAPWWLRNEWPFSNAESLPRIMPIATAEDPDPAYEDPTAGIWMKNGRVSTPYGTVPNMGDLLPRFTTAERDALTITDWIGRLIRVRDAGAPEEIHAVRETSTDGVYEWIIVAY
jgi:hypothetical protein